MKEDVVVKRFLSSVEIFLLVMSTVAISFIISQTSTVHAQVTLNPTERAPLYTSNTETGELEADGVATGTYSRDFPGAPSPDTPKPSSGDLLSGVTGLVSKIYGGDAATFGNFLGPLVSAAAWGFTVYGLVKLIGPLFGADQGLTDAIANAALAGIFAGRLAYFAVENGVIGSTGASGGPSLLGLTSTQAGVVLGLGVAVAVFLLTYKKEKKRVVTLECLPWEAPLGGSDCEKCNNDPLKPCSEYRCKSLGQACELVNSGSSEERCVWVARDDVNSPIITPWTNVLTQDHRYTDLQGRPPSRGTKIVFGGTSDGCIQPFTPLEFGIRTNEPSQCKIDLEGNKSFESMAFYFGESNLFAYNHTQMMRLPSPDSINVEGPDFPTEGTYNLYVRCRDANGNVNDDEFVFNFCVDKSPDATPPKIESTSIRADSSIGFGVQNVSLGVYINEPAECKWSVQDKSYDLMENAMSCSTHVYEQNARQLYPCTTTLTGLRDRALNTFFFRCKDQPQKPEAERNVNQESYRFDLKGSEVLSILSVSPNETFTGSTDSVRVNLTVRTDDGANEGRAICAFSPVNELNSFIAMFKTDSFEHEQVLTLPSGNYTYNFRCVDAGGNLATASTTFSVETDRNAPQVTRAYKETDALKIVTNEPAECRYSLASCNFVFSEGLAFTYLNQRDRMSHITQWRTNQVFYVKCMDNYGNEPSPNACSAIVSPSSAL